MAAVRLPIGLSVALLVGLASAGTPPSDDLALLQIKDDEGHGRSSRLQQSSEQLIQMLQPSGVVAENKKCPLDDRLFRITGSTTESCLQKCQATTGCERFAHAASGEYAGVCMGCSGTAAPADHDKFTLYSAPLYVVEENKKCPLDDRLFRITDSTPVSCSQKCQATAGCERISHDSSGQYKGVCMGCSKTAAPADHDQFTVYSINSPFDVVAENKKCPLDDRLFRITDSTPESCSQKCQTTTGCERISHDASGQYKGVCMGCSKTAAPADHDKFTLYSVNAPLYAVEESKKCPLDDRLFRITGTTPVSCSQKCQAAAGCERFSHAGAGPYAGVCMGCSKAAVPADHDKFTLYGI